MATTPAVTSEATPSVSFAAFEAFVEVTRMFSLMLSMRRRSAKVFLSASEVKLHQIEAFS